MHSQTEQGQYEDEIDFRELFSIIWAGKWSIIGITSFFAIASVIIALNIPNEYKATAVLAPAQSGSNGGLSAIASQFGGLASLAGINVGGGESNDTQIALEIMQSWGFIEQFIKKQNIQVEIFAAKGWDKDNNQLIIDNKLYDAENQRWRKDAFEGESIGPSSWKLYKSFSGRLIISQDKKTGLVSVSIEYFSPFLAKQWLDSLTEFINETMRTRKLNEVSRNIDYLQEQINQTSITEMKEVFYQIVEEQTKTQMLAEASPEYAFITVSSAMVPEARSKPKRAFICLLITLLGGFISLIFVFVMHYIKTQRGS